MLLLAMACQGPAAPPPDLAVTSRWPAAGVELVDTKLSAPVSQALSTLGGTSWSRCEAIEEALRCVVSGATEAQVLAALLELELDWAAGASAPEVAPLEPAIPQPTWLVLDAAPAAWAWLPAVLVRQRWPEPAVRPPPKHIDGDWDAWRAAGATVVPSAEVVCDGEPASALWVDRLPQEAPPDGVAVRTWSLTSPVHLQGHPDDLDRPLGPEPYCASRGVDRVAAVVDGTPEALAKRYPRLDVVPYEAMSKRWSVPAVDEAALRDLRQLDGVWAVRVVQHAQRSQPELALDPDALAAHGLTLASVQEQLQGGPTSMRIGAMVVPVQAPPLGQRTLSSAEGVVPLEKVATLSHTTVPTVAVRIAGQPAASVEVLVADDAAAAKVDAAMPSQSTDPWKVRRHRP